MVIIQEFGETIFNVVDWQDFKILVFGGVTKGMDVVKAVEAVGSSSGSTSQPVVVADCGQLS